MTTSADGAPQWRVRLHAVTHRGAVRERNEDCVGVGGWVLAGSEPPVLESWFTIGAAVDFVVADGLGGHQGGAEASRIAVSTFMANGGELRQDLVAASEAIHERSAAEPSLRGMGTTIAGLRFTPNGTASAFNVGDSRVYRIRDGYLGKLSVDDRPPAGSEHSSGVVTQVLGGELRTTFDPHEVSFLLAPGERLFLCTDGLHDVLEESLIADLLLLEAADAATGLLTETLAAGAPDNISFLILDIAELS